MNVGVLSAKSRSAPCRSDAKDLAMLYFPGVTIPAGFAWWCRAYSLAACIIMWNLLLA
jgi:hypothetical protein